jgi:hypothetical protein
LGCSIGRAAETLTKKKVTRCGFRLQLGEDIATQNARRKTVGMYTADGVVTNDRSGYCSMHTWLESPAQLGVLRQWLISNPTLAVDALTQAAYLRQDHHG